MESQIAIEGIQCYAYHGCMEEEGIIGRHFSIDVYVNADVSKSFESDALEDTIDYEKVCTLVRSEMAVRSKLIEHAGSRIVKAIERAFHSLQKITVRVIKYNPPVKGQTHSTSVTVSSTGSH